MDRKLQRREEVSLVDQAVDHLRALVFRSEMDKLLKVARYLLATFFEGDLEAALSRQGNKESSLNELSQRSSEFGMSVTGVLKAIPVMVQCRELGADLGRKLTFTHHVALLPVQSPATKKKLAAEVERDRLSVRQLRQRVREKQAPHAGGRAPTPPLISFVRHTGREIARRNLKKRLTLGLEDVERAELSALLDEVNRQQATFEALEKTLIDALARL